MHLPAASRYACRITTGDRVLLAAEPGEGILLNHPLATLDAMISQIHNHGTAGDAV